mgnify:CR=1 FL=1
MYIRTISLYVCFVDLKSAFDTVPRAKLWEKMACWGIPTRLLSAIIDLHTSTWVQVKVGNGKNITRKISTYVGLKQGCVLAPCLFNIYMADLSNELGQIICDAPKLAKLSIPSLQYADDIVLMSRTQICLQRSVQGLANYTTTHGLVLNRKKTKVMCFTKAKQKRNHRYTWHIEGEHPEVVQMYKYLGVVLDTRFNYKYQKEQLMDGMLNNADIHRQSQRSGFSPSFFCSPRHPSLQISPGIKGNNSD